MFCACCKYIFSAEEHKVGAATGPKVAWSCAAGFWWRTIWLRKAVTRGGTPFEQECQWAG